MSQQESAETGRNALVLVSSEITGSGTLVEVAWETSSQIRPVLAIGEILLQSCSDEVT